MMIDENSSREDLLTALYAEGALVDHFIAKDLDPEFMSTDAIRDEVIAWIEAGDECAAA